MSINNLLYINESETGAYISDTLRLDEAQTEIEARMSISNIFLCSSLLPARLFFA
jgi:hypothetical protein